MPLRVSGAQIPVTEDIVANLQAIHRAIDYALSEQADVLLTPEGSLSGYTPHFDPDCTAEALREITGRARDAGLALALGTCFCEPDDGRRYNQLRFYAQDGRYLGFHSKTLLCGSLEEPVEGEIRQFAVRPLRTFDLNHVTIGGLICNDLWANPGCTPQPDLHLTQRLAESKARVVFHAVNGGRDGSEWSRVAWQYHEANLRMRARAGGLWIVTADSSYPLNLDCSAPSGVLDPEGNWVMRTPPRGEQYFACTLPLPEDT